MNELQRYMHLYDSAVEGFAKSCQIKNLYAQRSWKKRLNWLDKMLAEHGEIYMEKEAD